MAGYFAAAAKVTSTACLLWSAYLIARSRGKHRRSTKQSDISDDLDEDVSLGSFCPTESFTYPSEAFTGTHNMIAGASCYIRSGWRRVACAFRRSSSGMSRSGETVEVTTGRAFPQLSVDVLTTYMCLICGLAEQANIPLEIRNASTCTSRLRILGSNDSPEKLLNTLLTALVCFTKNDLFAALFLTSEQGLQTLGQLALEILEATSNKAEAPCSPEKTEDPDRAIHCRTILNQSPTMDWPSASYSNKATADRQSNQTTYTHLEYPFHLLFAHSLANLSRHPASQNLIHIPAIQSLLSQWSCSSSLHLTLLGQKTCHNLEAHAPESSKNVDGDSCKTEIQHCPVYYPDVYRLDSLRSDTRCADYDCDVIFVHGMRGSVFFTWRQNDAVLENAEANAADCTKCWPRDWLPREFPSARILAINSSLYPFVWDPICPVDRLERAMDTRAKNILPQLEAAGVGQRPIIWITHSAGGILVKELLRVSSQLCMNGPKPNSSATVTNDHNSTSDHHSGSVSVLSNQTSTNKQVTSTPESSRVEWSCDLTDEAYSRSSAPSLLPEELMNWFVGDKECCTDSVPSSPAEKRYCYPIRSVESEGGLINIRTHNVKDEPEADSNLIQFTQGIVFMSAPHRGNRSLLGLYRRPFRWTLTPEAIQLERNSTFLLDLHSWFKRMVTRSHIKVLSMVETQQTQLGRFWSVLLVPEDEDDREMGEVVHIDSDHTSISKPRDPTDPVYRHIAHFIRQLREPTDTAGAHSVQTESGKL
ncbi:putative ribonuclease p/mrp subunit [Paragonimus heterotremus]|uniref:Putative ribonuclease p/mrp subunit n=1 Tax=Paragonimus heterotremus TaxID=100268 RepID=A0A8J4WFZ8_9TREM|nr:putative ribonuclease p/mrp subunit [Paragonimus heterotremus]